MSPDRPAAVVVLAAGEGTRMKSAIPKVLHAVGGRTPGRPRGRRRRSPGPRPPGRRRRPRAGRGHRAPGRGRPGGRHRRAGASSSAPATPSRSRSRRCPRLDGTVVVTYGDVPLLTAETLQGAARRPRRPGQRRHHAHRPPRRPHRLRPDRARRRRRGRRHRRAEGRHRGAARGPRDQLRRLRLRRRDPARRPRPARHRQRAGRGLPHRRGGASRSPTAVASVPSPSPDTWAVEGVNDRVQLAGPAPRAEPPHR